MAEFCLRCLNGMNNTYVRTADVRLEYDLCEGCGIYKPCVFDYKEYSEAAERRRYRRQTRHYAGCYARYFILFDLFAELIKFIFKGLRALFRALFKTGKEPAD